jgi:hypothetical protein
MVKDFQTFVAAGVILLPLIQKGLGQLLEEQTEATSN